MPDVCWLIFRFQLAWGAVFYPIHLVPVHGGGSISFNRRECLTLADCDADYLCNIWSENDKYGNGPACFYGNPQVSYIIKKGVWLKVRSKTQCESGKPYSSEIGEECFEGFECNSMVSAIISDSLPIKKDVLIFDYSYTQPETGKTLFTFEVTKDPSEAPFTEDNYAKMYKITLTSQEVSTCGYAIGNETMSGPTVSCTVGEPMQLYCRNEKLYFDAEMKTGQLVQYLLDGKNYLPL